MVEIHICLLFLFLAGNKITKNTVCILITLIWLYSLLWAILPLIGWGYYGPEPFGISCTIAWSQFHNSSSGFSFILSMFLLCTILPALTIVACYLGIAWKVHKAYQEIQNIDRIPNAAKLEKKLTLVSDEKSLQWSEACRDLALLVHGSFIAFCLVLTKNGDVVPVSATLCTPQRSGGLLKTSSFQ